MTPMLSAAAARPLWRTFLVFLGPMLLSNILQALSGTINNIYIGQLLGVQAMAAVSGFFPVVFFFVSFIIGLGAGASVLIGQAWGARDLPKVKAITGTALTVGILIGLVVAVIGLLFTRQILVGLGTPTNILEEATEYARVMLITMPPIFLFLLVTAMMRGVSDTLTPLLALMLSTVVGLALTPVLIHGWAGLPKTGIASGAWASMFSTCCALLWLGLRMRRRGHPLAPDALLLGHLRINPTLLATVLRIGIPTAVQMIVISLAEVALLSMVNGFGSDATAAYGAVNQIVAYVQFPAISIAITSSILGAQAIGAGHADRLGAITRTGLMMNLVLTGGLVVLAYLASRMVIGLFITSAPVVDLAQTLLHIMLWSSVIMGMAGVLSGVMRASGTVLVPMAISIACIALVEVPVAWVFSHRIGVEGIWISYPAAFIAMLICQTAFYRLVWKKRAVRVLV